MVILPILRYPDPRLHKVASPVQTVDARIQTLVADMIATMYDADGVPMDVCQLELAVIAESKEYVPMIEKELWFEIDARKRRERWAA